MNISKQKTINADTIHALENITGEQLSLGNLLSAIRQGEGKTLVEFAALLSISRQYLCDLEHGRRFASPKAAVAYAPILGYSKEQFLRLCLQDMVNRDQLHVIVEVKKAA